MTDLGFDPKLVRRGIFRGLDLTRLAKRLWQLEAMRAESPLPVIDWRASMRRTSVSGRAWKHRIVLTIGIFVGREVELDRVIEVLLHELVHCSCPPKEHHGELFQRRLIACAREAFGPLLTKDALLELDTTALLATPVESATRIFRTNRAYLIDEVIRKAMVASNVSEHMHADAELAFVAPPAATEEEIKGKKKAASDARQNERKEHCVTMLRSWERRAARAKKLATKWQKRVRYYEQREAHAAKPTRGES